MDSDPPGGGGEPTPTVSASAATTSVPAAAPALKPRLSAEIKVYARRYPGRKPKPPPDPNPSSPPEALTLAPEAAALAEPVASPSTAVPAAAPRSPSPPHPHPEADAPATGVAPPSLVVSSASPALPHPPEAAVRTAEVAPPFPVVPAALPASSPPSAHLPFPEAAAPSSPSPRGPSPEAAAPSSQSPHRPSPEAAAPSSQSPHRPSPEAAAPSSQSPHRPSPEAAAPSSQSPHRPSPEAAAPSSPSPHRPSPKAATPADKVAPPSPAIPEAAQPPLPSSSPPALAPTAPPEDATAAVICINTSTGLNRDGGGSGGAFPNGVEERARDAALKRKERRELRRRLAAELEQVRMLGKQLDAAADALAVAAASTPAPPRPPALLLPAAPVEAGYVRSQFSATVPGTPIPTPGAAVTPGHSLLQRQPLTVSVVPTESFEKEKRTPKANQYYHNSEFLLAKDRFPPANSHGHNKSKHHKKRHSLSADSAAERRLYSHPFKKCESLLGRLMKHRFGWVFNKPVDPVKLGLHDYFMIIKHPMDLGTIKGLLNHRQYRNPREFAEDVRLTFHNAMTYNPKGQDVHFMAEQLLGIFEAQWPEIEAEVEYLASCPPLPKKFPPPPIDLRVLERSDSTMHRMLLDSKSKPISHTPPYSARTPALKKPKAKDPDKRDMTPEEKQKLSNNLQNLPIEKLNTVVQIIKNKNLSVRHNDDEIEVDIDSMDAETLWELDRFVTNYRKNLSKHKRKAELARQNAEMHAQQAAQQTSQEPNAGESPKQNEMAEEQLATFVPAQDGNNGGNISRSSSSSGSSSESGSSSSDSDSDSSSANGSDAAIVS